VPKSKSFASSIIVVTGATAGVGRAVALAFARRGARLGLIARDREALEIVAAEIRTFSSDCAIAAVDVADAGAVKTAASQFVSDLGPIDIWVNDAMLTVFSPISRITPEEFRRVTEVTYLGVVHGCMAALAVLQPGGQIINIGSALAYRGIPLQSAYCGAKHAIRGFTASLRTELDHDKSGIAVSLLELPAMNTPQFDWARTHMPRRPMPMGTIYQPEAAAAAVLRVARTRAREYWVGNSTLLTIVGNMIAPWYLDRLLARTAVEGQETNQAVSPERRDNLFESVTDLHRTHGRFGDQARASAAVYPGDATRAAIVAAGALVFCLLGMALARLSSRD
jgi:NAD(P)-dependent dehydrogenase (short-subunit alcohol dehydrogenase family)